MTRLVLRIVKDEPCPKCGAMWGHPDPKLNFPNRPKVDDWWRCYNPNCPVHLYRPGTGECVTLEERRALLRRTGFATKNPVEGDPNPKVCQLDAPPSIENNLITY